MRHNINPTTHHKDYRKLLFWWIECTSRTTMNCRSRKKCYRLTEGANKVINGENAEVVTEELTDVVSVHSQC